MSDYPVWLNPLLGFIFGLQFGSFITLVSFRLPDGQDVIVTPSRCPSCLHRLSIRDLFPVLSWLASGRKCRYCAAAVSARYPFIEMIAGLLGALLCYTTVPLTLLFFVKAVAMIFGWCAAMMAFEQRRAPVGYFTLYAICLSLLAWSAYSPLVLAAAVYIGAYALLSRKNIVKYHSGMVLSAPCALLAGYVAFGGWAAAAIFLLLSAAVAYKRVGTHISEGLSHTIFVLAIALPSSII